ncbi:MAG: Nif3-like dinuclear metal center hexameric protein [Verrucomicrobiales bacterium]
MANLTEVVSAMDGWLQTSAIPDYPGAINGLQLANAGRVGRVACAVDACEAVIEDAVEAGADLLLVHHGMFWSGAQPIKGAQYRKLRRAIEGGMAIYSSHLPLDVHPEMGNNIQLARAIGMESPETFFPWKGIQLGLRGLLGITREELRRRLESATGAPVHVCPGGPELVEMAGLITGGAGGEVGALGGMGVDTFITGEGPHWSYTAAEEMGINLFYAGHYATETFGVKALAAELERVFHLPWSFIDHPSGL